MLYSLSTQVISDTVHAIVALKMLSASPGECSLLSPLVEPSRRGLLTLMIKNAFAELLVGLLPYVDQASLDDEKAQAAPSAHPVDDAADHLLQISLRVPAAVSSAGIHGVIRRHLEMAVVYRLLHTALINSGSLELESVFASRLTDHMASLRSLLSASASPLVRDRFF